MKVRDIIHDCAQWLPSRDYESASPVVSVLLPTFRRAKSGLFSEAVNSVLNQSYQNLELIVIDDASTDGTADLIGGFMKKDSRVSTIRHRYNVGLPAISEYEGYRKARGKYIAFLFDDNVWEPDYLEKTICFMEDRQAKAAYGCVKSFWGSENEYELLGHTETSRGIHSLISNNFIANGGVVLDREVIETVGLYDPHVTMTRLCDWGLWKRIVGKYLFYETGILAGAEKGGTQSDSLGNSYRMNYWAAAEREAQSENSMFLPDRFEELEINAVAPDSSRLFCDVVNEFYEGYSQKRWYRPEQERKAEGKLLHIFVAASTFDATVCLSFQRMAAGKSRFVFRFGNVSTPDNEILEADAVVIVRNAVGFTSVRRMCRRYQIPCFLYLDDNFILLAEEFQEDASFQAMKDMLSSEMLEEYDHLITSTEPLKAFFADRNVKIPITAMPQCIGDVVHRNAIPVEEASAYVFAFMGEPFRDETFVNVVMPTLKRISEKHRVKLVCPSRIDLSKYAGDNLEIIGIPFLFSLEEALKHYSLHKPQFLLHCGPEIKNNPYQTENALYNAVQLGAVLAASKNPPFTEFDGRLCVCAENSVDAWYRTLDALLSDENTRQRLYRGALDFCRQQHSVENALEAFDKVCARLKPANLFVVMQRFEKKAQSKPSRALGKRPLSYTGEVHKRLTYRIRCRAENFSELGVCFYADGAPRGAVKMSLYDSGKLLREATLDMAGVVRSGWSYFTFEPISNAEGRVYRVALDFQYGFGSDGMGLFEDSTKRTLLYRALNKLGCKLKRMDVLFADCR